MQMNLRSILKDISPPLLTNMPPMPVLLLMAFTGLHRYNSIPGIYVDKTKFDKLLLLYITIND